METSTMCQPSITYGSSQEDFLASLLVSPGSEKAQQMTVGSGQKWLELLNASDRVGYWLKMCLESSAWNSTRCYLTWNVSIISHGRLLFRLSASMPRIEERGFGLWATPAAADSVGSTGGGQGRSLRTDVRMWPTPTTQDAHNNGGPSQHTRNTPPLNAVAGGSLNPEFVEWLMGYPIGWTELED